MRFRFVLTALSLMLIAVPALSATESLKFGIVPQESSSRLADQWTPLMRYLSTRLGMPVRFMTAPDIPTFEKRVLAGEYDIAYMNPYHYVAFSETPGYRAIVKEGGKQIHGIVVVPEDASADRLEDLDGMTVAFPAPAAFAATILVRAELERLGVRYQPRFVGSHESVYLNVQRGFAEAGGGVERTLAIAMREGLDGVRVLWRSPGYTPHAFAVAPKMDPILMASIQSLLVGLGDTEEGLSLLDRAHLKPLVPAEDSDWDDIRRLGLDFIKTSGAP